MHLRLSQYWFMKVILKEERGEGVVGNYFERDGSPSTMGFYFVCRPGGPLVGRSKICSPFYFLSVLLSLILSPSFLFSSLSSFSSFALFSESPSFLFFPCILRASFTSAVLGVPSPIVFGRV